MILLGRFGGGTQRVTRPLRTSPRWGCRGGRAQPAPPCTPTPLTAHGTNSYAPLSTPAPWYTGVCARSVVSPAPTDSVVPASIAGLPATSRKSPAPTAAFTNRGLPILDVGLRWLGVGKKMPGLPSDRQYRL